MATSKKSKPSTKPKVNVNVKRRAPAAAASPSKLQNLAARPASFDESDEQMVDHSGVFRVTSSIKQAQIGHDDDNNPRFASDSLVMAAQRDNFREEGATLDEAVDENAVEDLDAQALRRQRLATLAQRAQARTRPRR